MTTLISELWEGQGRGHIRGLFCLSLTLTMPIFEKFYTERKPVNLWALHKNDLQFESRENVMDP